MAENKNPLILKDVTLMSPGNWNGWNYHVEELKKAFDSTNWQDEHITSLFLDHPENPANAAAAWIGRVINPKQLADGTVQGDVEIWDQDIIFKLTKAKAGFGISPRVVGKEDEETKTFLDFSFDNFCIVAKPAQSTAYLHLAENIKFTGAVRQLSTETKETEKELKQIEKYSTKSKLKEKLKGGKKTMSDEEKNAETEEVVEKSTESEESESEESEEKKEELSDADVLSIMNADLEGFNAYAKETKVANPTISLKELAIKFKISQERSNFIEELSESEATILLKKLLAKIGVDKAPKVDTASQDLANKIASMEKTIKELGKKEKVPAPKSVKNLTSVEVETPMFGNKISDGVRELAQVLKNR